MYIATICLEAGKIVLEPGNVDDIQKVSWLVKKQGCGLEEHSACTHRLHLPSTRKVVNNLIATSDGC